MIDSLRSSIIEVILGKTIRSSREALVTHCLRSVEMNSACAFIVLPLI